MTIGAAIVPPSERRPWMSFSQSHSGPVASPRRTGRPNTPSPKLLGQSYPEVEWRRLVLELPTPDLLPGDYGSILTLHLAALTALLQVGPTRIASENDHRLEDLLLDHEQIYWDDTAAARGLGQPSKSKLLRAAVASAALVGAEDVIAARRVLTAVPLVNKVPELQYEVADWLHELYPVPDHFWGPIRPTRSDRRTTRRKKPCSGSPAS